MLAPGSPAPDLPPLTAIDGSQLAPAGAAGSMLLAFFKVSCPTCQFTFPFLERIAAAAPELKVVGVSQDGPKAAAEFARTFGLSFAVHLDEAAAGYPASNAYQITHVPSLFLVEQGRISEAISGFSRVDLEAIAARFGASSPFRPGEKIPEFRPG